MPAFARAILIQESAEGGLSYKGTKNVPWHILASAAVACDIIIVRRSAHPAGGFLYNRKYNFLLYKKRKMEPGPPTLPQLSLIISLLIFLVKPFMIL